MAITTSAANDALDHVIDGSDAALYEGDPNGSGTEVSGGSYSRQSVSWNSASSGEKDNSAEIVWSDLPTDAQITHIALMDSSDNLLDVRALSDTFSPSTDDNELTIQTGNLTVSLS